MAAIRLTRTHRILIGIVVMGAVVIAGIGFAGSYAAVRTLALHKGFGWFANVFPIGVDAGIVVLLALDLLLTWLRIPFPLLRQTAWLLTAATIAFNGAAAWPDPLGVGMHAIIPVLFVVSVEAARHAIGRIADITADKHMESVRITRWLLAPVPTFRLWRRMKLWELRSYEEVIRREQDRLVYRARLRARYGVAWRRRAPVEAIMPLRLARYGVPLSETADAGLEAAGIDVGPPVKQLEAAVVARPAADEPGRADRAAASGPAETAAGPGSLPGSLPEAAPEPGPQPADDPGFDEQQQAYEQELYESRLYEQQMYEQQPYEEPPQISPHDSPWFAAQQVQQPQQANAYAQQQIRQQPQAQPQYEQQPYEQQQYQQPPYEQSGPQQQQPPVMVPNGPYRQRPLGNPDMNGTLNGFNGNGSNGRPAQEFREPPYVAQPQGQPQPQAQPTPPEPAPASAPDANSDTYPAAGLNLPDGVSADEAYFAAYRRYVRERGDFPGARQLARALQDFYGGTAPEERQLITSVRELRYRYNSEAESEYIP
ncbi:DUF2637 domain-containing protein [Actinacidiphila sp. ITFR-21]|uniref:DUF2637 domain-containing protein n=1 Tax=Actinacidiphila sp. ITFR-21 TaxID=3075199 RepID=UPI00288ACDF0|nr:DUF2637 domain-containing protein [Streptomyces sp. ITFR-21]WNI17146.1 DUF2637 domain-containing protein [Streptomyces sp. ITFR-21]